MSVKVDVPVYSSLIESVVERSTERILIDIENTAKLTAPVDTGFYRNNIGRNVQLKEVTAKAVYSAAVEYGVSGTRRMPNPVMRNAARSVQKKVPTIVLEVLKSV